MVGKYNNLTDGLTNVKRVLQNISNEVRGMFDEWDISLNRQSDLIGILDDCTKTAINIQSIIDDIYEEEHPDE